jgi:hypothetical protein
MMGGRLPVAELAIADRVAYMVANVLGFVRSKRWRGRTRAPAGTAATCARQEGWAAGFPDPKNQGGGPAMPSKAAR